MVCIAYVVEGALDKPHTSPANHFWSVPPSAIQSLCTKNGLLVELRASSEDFSVDSSKRSFAVGVGTEHYIEASSSDDEVAGK